MKVKDGQEEDHLSMLLLAVARAEGGIAGIQQARGSYRLARESYKVGSHN